MKTIAKILIALAVIIVLVAALFAVGHFLGWWHFGDLIGDVQSYSYETVKSIDIDLTTAEITFLPGEKLTVETNHKYAKCSVTAKTLSIKENSTNIPTSKNLPYVKITVPAGFDFDSFKIKTTAGVIAGGGFSAHRMIFDLKGGVLELDSVQVTEKFTVNQLGGKIGIKNSVLYNADMDLTAGDCEIDATVKGSSYLECGSGVLKLALKGNKDDYAVTFKRVIGSATLNGQSVEPDKTYGDGTDAVRLNGGAGKIEVTFSE